MIVVCSLLSLSDEKKRCCCHSSTPWEIQCAGSPLESLCAPLFAFSSVIEMGLWKRILQPSNESEGGTMCSSLDGWDFGVYFLQLS